MATDKGGERETDDHTADDKPGSVSDQSHAKCCRGSQELEEAMTISWTKGIDQYTSQDTSKDSSGDRGNSSPAEISLGQVEVVSDDWNERGSGECGKEGDEEGHPIEVERQMMRFLQRERRGATEEKGEVDESESKTGRRDINQVLYCVLY